jgi:hypothetical protein
MVFENERSVIPTIQEIAENNSLNLIPGPRKNLLLNHPIDPIQPLIDIFKKEETSTGTRLIRSPTQSAPHR